MATRLLVGERCGLVKGIAPLLEETLLLGLLLQPNLRGEDPIPSARGASGGWATMRSARDGERTAALIELDAFESHALADEAAPSAMLVARVRSDRAAWLQAEEFFKKPPSLAVVRGSNERPTKFLASNRDLPRALVADRS